MPLLDITNPNIIKFLVENYNKTARLTLRWNQQHKGILKQAATLNREDKNIHEVDVFKASITSGLATTARDHISSTRNRRTRPQRDTDTVHGISYLRKGHSIVDVGLGDPTNDPRLVRPITDLQQDPTMRPVDPTHTEILYKDKPVFGRMVYLKTRSHISPEDKYYFKESKGWEYGWRLKDSPFGRNQGRRGRVWRLKRDMASRRGPGTRSEEPPCDDPMF